MLLPDSMRNASTGSDAPPSSKRRHPWRRAATVAFLVLWGGMALWHANKPLPPGTHIAGPSYQVSAKDVAFIADITAADAYGRPILSQAIFDEELRIVHSARQLLVLDYFLFNNMQGPAGDSTPQRALSRELRDAL